jgi:hypothetical protein
MSLDVDAAPTMVADRATAAEPGAGSEPIAGVIEDARSRQRARRRVISIAALLAALAAASLGAILSGGSPSGHRASGGDGQRAAARSTTRSLRPARISPALTGGSYGWNVMSGGGGSCCTVPLKGQPLGGETTTETAKGEETATFLVGPELAVITLHRRRLPTEFTALPFGLRLARVTVRQPVHGLSLWPAGARALGALDREGRKLPQPTFSSGPAIASRWWKRPAAPARGPCRLETRGLPALSARWGHVASALRPYDRPIDGRAFFSCIDTEYYLHNWPLQAAILLDADRPGRTPAALPEMTPVAGAPGVFASPGTWQGALSALRLPHSWLVVAGGNGPAQRLEVLRHLVATVSLPARVRSG